MGLASPPHLLPSPAPHLANHSLPCPDGWLKERVPQCGPRRTLHQHHCLPRGFPILFQGFPLMVGEKVSVWSHSVFDTPKHLLIIPFNKDRSGSP